MKRFFMRFYYDDDTEAFILRILRRDEDGKKYVLQGRKWTKIAEGDHIEPTAMFFNEFVKEDGKQIFVDLLDTLIAQGVRPTKPIENPSELKAVKYHLEDMRKIIFEKEE